MTVSSNSWSLVSNKQTIPLMKRTEIFGHAPLFLGIHAMISSISHKTQMWLCGMLISFSVHFFVSPIEWNILLSRPRRSLWKMTTWESGINGLVQCIFDKKECDARNHKHLLLALVRMVHVEKKTLREILSEIPLFFPSMPSHELRQPDF